MKFRIGILFCILLMACGKDKSCFDGQQNQGERGIDCCGPCEPCLELPDCDPFNYVDIPRCTDGIKNGDEIEIDCGGSSCDPCSVEPSCNDGVLNGNETGIDCGGADCTPCIELATCTDGIQNGEEQGIDCGGLMCPPCQETPSCFDGQQNGDETGIDCGGQTCVPCNDIVESYISFSYGQIDLYTELYIAIADSSGNLYLESRPLTNDKLELNIVISNLANNNLNFDASNTLLYTDDNESSCGSITNNNCQLFDIEYDPEEQKFSAKFECDCNPNGITNGYLKNITF